MKIPVYNRHGDLLTHIEQCDGVGALHIEVAAAPDDTPDMRKFAGTFIFQSGPRIEDCKFVEVDTKSFLCIGDGELFELP